MACQARGLPRGHCRGHEEMLNLKGAGMYWEALGSNVARDSCSTDVRISHEKKHEMSSTMMTTTEHNWMFISRSGVVRFRGKIFCSAVLG